MKLTFRKLRLLAKRIVSDALIIEFFTGISAIRKSKNETELPNPRVISTVILKDIPTGTSTASSMLVLWGQFVNHDITLTAPSTSVNATAVPCCVDGKLLTSQHPECLPLRIPQADPLFSMGVSCMNFVRSAPAPLCEFGMSQAEFKCNSTAKF